MNIPIFQKLQTGAPIAVLLEMKGIHDSVEAELEAQVKSEVGLVQDVGTLTLRAGGKRLRPLVAALAGLTVSPTIDRARMVRLGACLEMIHMATLIHDDVIDGALTRRGKPTAAAEYGTTASILSGDALLAKAMRILAQDGDLQIIRTVSSAVVEMAEGEVREVEVRGDFELTEEEHIQILRMKTAAFVECGCMVGAMVAQATDSQIEALGRYGHHMGLAFQIADDLLDFRGDHAKTGKPQATDFREGCATLPLIYLRQTLTDAEAAQARGWFGNVTQEDQVRTVSRWMSERGCYDKASRLAQEHVDKALASLETLPETPYRRLLSLVSGFVVTREA